MFLNFQIMEVKRKTKVTQGPSNILDLQVARFCACSSTDPSQNLHIDPVSQMLVMDYHFGVFTNAF